MFVFKFDTEEEKQQNVRNLEIFNMKVDKLINQLYNARGVNHMDTNKSTAKKSRDA